MFKLPELGYEYGALEPYIDAKTMEIHYSKHHATYVNNLNNILQGSDFEYLENKDLENLLRTLDKVPSSLRQAVRNNAGGHANHSLFWLLLKNPDPQGSQPSDLMLKLLESNFGTYEIFIKQFKATAMAHFGSGWTWLVINLDSKKLEILSTANQDSPFMDANKVPLIGVDVWEHAYYLKHQNMRANWLDDFFRVLNWGQVEENYRKVSQA